MPYQEEVNELDYMMESCPKCPYCDHRDEEWWDGAGYREDEEIDIQCPSCLKWYCGTMEVTSTFTTRPQEKSDE